MAVTVETGAIVTGADSYVSRADYITYAATLGVTIASAAAADIELVKAAQYIDQHEANLKGTKYTRGQPMAFPRDGVTIDGWYWTATEIPRQVILCQMAFALDVNAGRDLWNRGANPGLVATNKTVVGAVSVSYAVNPNAQKLSRNSTADALLASLLKNSGLRMITAERS